MVALAGFLASVYFLWAHFFRDDPKVISCENCYYACEKAYVETGTFDSDTFKWTDCRDYCRGVQQCEESFQRSYVETILELRTWFTDNDETAFIASRKSLRANDAGPLKTPVKVAAMKRVAVKNGKKITLSQTQKDLLNRKSWKDAKSFCRSGGGRLPTKDEMVQHLLLLPKQQRTGVQFWASGPLYPDGSPPVIGMTLDSFVVVPASPLELHGVHCF